MTANINCLVNCCAPPPIVCDRCGTSAKQQVQVVVSGISNQNCGSCGSLNGTFVLDYDHSFAVGSSGNVCGWRYTLPSPVCSTPAAIAQLVLVAQHNISGQSMVLLQFQDSTGTAWLGAANFTGEGGTMDCDWDGLVLDSVFDNSYSDCNISSPAATVTAL